MRNENQSLPQKASATLPWSGPHEWSEVSVRVFSLYAAASTAVIFSVTDLDQWMLRICLDCRRLGNGPFITLMEEY